LGGRVEFFLGQNLRDFFPVAIEKIHGGLTITKMHIELQEEERYLGFAGTFPSLFEPRRFGHPRALIMQENQEQAEHEGNQVLHKGASVLPQR